MPAESVPGASLPPEAVLLQQLRDLLPAAFPDGELDPAALLEALGVQSDLKAGPSFNFTWPGIETARQVARTATTATLVPDMAASVDWDNATDVLIEGDNVQVLKLLLRGYTGAAKLIYIDPPYNTGETFVYSDDYSMPEADYLQASGQLDEQGAALTSQIENAGRKHAPWLTMMFPRLALARHLLKRDGVILISIDDNEFHHLRVMMDGLFGADNFIGTFVWQGGRKNDARRLSVGHDYIVAYARDAAYLKDQDIRWRERKGGLEDIYAKAAELRQIHGEDWSAASADLQAWYKALPEGSAAKEHAHYRFIDAGGVWYPDNISSPNYRENLVFNWKGYSPPTNGWRYERPTMERLDAEGLLIYPESMDKRIQFKRYLHNTEEWAPASVFYKDRRAASKALAALMGAEVFDYPKDVDVLARLIHSITGDDDLIIDFFAGSGTTAHAVWQQNQADGKQRRWLLVQAPEITEATSKARAEGYETIFELTLERLKRAGRQIDATTPPGFRVFRCRPTNLVVGGPIVATEGMTGEQYLQQTLVREQQPAVIEGADDLAVAWEAVLKATATQLDADYERLEGNDFPVYCWRSATGTGRLLVCLGTFDLAVADSLNVTADDTVILRSDQVTDETTLTLAPRCRLVLLERVPREVSL